MKCIGSLLAFMFFSLNAFSQNLSLSQFHNFIGKNFTESEEYLSSKGWEYVRKDRMDRFVFELKSTSLETISYFTFSVDELDNIDMLVVTLEKKKYNEFLDVVKSYGCELVSSIIHKDNSIQKCYRGKTLTFSFRIFPDKNEFHVKQQYHMAIFRNSNKDNFFHCGGG